MQKAKFIIFIVVFVLLMVGSMAVFADETKGDGGGNIILWDIVEGVTEANRSDGNGDGGGDIILWDIVEGATDSNRSGG